MTVVQELHSTAGGRRMPRRGDRRRPNQLAVPVASRGSDARAVVIGCDVVDAAVLRLVGLMTEFADFGQVLVAARSEASGWMTKALAAGAVGCAVGCVDLADVDALRAAAGISATVVVNLSSKLIVQRDS